MKSTIVNPKTLKPFAGFDGHGPGFGNQMGTWNPRQQTADAALLPGLGVGNASSFVMGAALPIMGCGPTMVGHSVVTTRAALT